MKVQSMVYGSKGGVIMSKNDDIQYWVDRFIPLFRDYFSDVIDEKEFEEKTGVLQYGNGTELPTR